jgi:hypothetical protein
LASTEALDYTISASRLALAYTTLVLVIDTWLASKHNKDNNFILPS